MQFEIISSYQTLEAWQESQAIDVSVTWQNFRNQYIYLLLDEKTRSNEIASYLKSATRTIDRDPSGHQVSFAIQALNDIVPGPELYNQIGPEWGYLSLYIFGILSLLILLPACFNYTNLSISRALKRAKEIGLRKAMGGQQNQIFLQFITETVLITLLSLLGAFGIFALVREEFLSLLVSADALELNVDMQTTACFILFAVCVGLVAGVLPAIYFSRLNPVQALRNVIPGGMLAGMSLRKCLMVFQFALSLGFIMSVAIILKQYRSALNYDFGFERANILDVELQDVDPQLFRNEFSKLAAIQTISMSSGIMGTSTPDRVWLKKTDHGDSLQAFEMLTDQHYVKNLSLTLLAGTGFSDNVNENKEQILINEEFLKEFKLGAPAEAVGQSLIVPGQGNVHIRGVVKDFHYMLLDERIHSFFFRYDSDHARYANLKIASNDLFKTFTDMEAAWERVSDQRVFHAKFFEDEIEETFMGYFSIVKICSFLGILAISISCLGLLGMVVYAAENRTKEVGIRKIMGATNLQLVVLLSKSFLRLLFFSTVVAVPVTYFLFDTMLRHMQYYQINIGVLEIVISIFVMLLLGVITTLSQTLRVVKTNPADTMRCE
jgi:ABC-type lipoprotein release transport system permease subunit